MIKAIIFDLDGTLTNTLNAISHFGNLALRENGFEEIEKDKYRYLVGNGKSVLIHRMLEYLNADTNENYIKVLNIYDKYYEAEPLYDTDAYDGIREILHKLKKLGIKTAVCSNKPDNVAQDVIKQIFGDNIFDYVMGATDNIPLKPDKEMAILISKALGVSPSKCIFTGDTYIDMMTAKNAGMVSVGVLWGFRDYDELKQAGADYIISNPEEYLKYI